MIQTKLFTAYSETTIQGDIDRFWLDHPHATLLAQSQSECFVANDDAWSISVCMTIQEEDSQ